MGEPGLSLIYAAGGRPSASDIERALGASANGAISARISHRPDDEAGWLELLASGLTFDLKGLVPGMTASHPAARHCFGLPKYADRFEFEAITLSPGQHVAAGAAMIPLVRVMLGLASLLAKEIPVMAICWNPAQSWMDPGYFSRLTTAWLAGGAFPALGLTGIERTQDGGVESDGLAFFIGQELRVESREKEAAADTVKLAVRMIDYLVREGPLVRRRELNGPDGEELIAEPSPDGRSVRLWRAG